MSFEGFQGLLAFTGHSENYRFIGLVKVNKDSDIPMPLARFGFIQTEVNCLDQIRACGKAYEL